MQSLVGCYRQDLARRGYRSDPRQLSAIQQLEQVYQKLLAPAKRERFFGAKWPAIKGLYLYGGVGCGKTYLMDLFFTRLPIKNKKRLHFYHLMRYVHQQLELNKGKKNPLELVAKSLADDFRVLCVDEFLVSDIGDAMILTNLLKALFANRVTLVCTSNIMPSELYKNGLQRQQFIPAIALIEQNCAVYCLPSETDYRLLELKDVNRYFEGLGSDDMLADIIGQLFELQRSLKPQPISINGRAINSLAHNNQAIWFHFDDLCDGPRSTQDYIDISKTYKTIIVSRVPQFDYSDDLARRFISLIDECYDQRIMVFISAHCDIDNLYRGGHLKFEYQRTKSRLLEMQTAKYANKLVDSTR